ncbi:DNA sulfur modification protein DndD [Litorivivens lipolytica]|uniref:DNA sulfur modification protein DndD n=1 Tax=Litorivivens lipolytica TaxID=1524264 RepID=A0A7W4W5Y4_9GAMM|nr:DNA sulfur modification protein DndD [Litorivivens lipolytica]MBB3047427.1 DNA sulfur modification protein DndD [Litorivivens lipolytica]
MIIETLVLRDYRAYSGEHHFDLTPRKKWNKIRPIVLFGGLNGAGKTSILSSIRLALYGKGALGHSVSAKQYEEYLKQSIHKFKSNSGSEANSASVSLTFTYAKHGKLLRYKVIREWETKKTSVKESLSLYQNDEPISNLNYEQCQGFLNELIPIGVSELFFFDGEKIADLADDEDGVQLGDAIKRLMGLDLLETLDIDLQLVTRNLEKSSATKIDQKRIAALESEYGRLVAEAEKLQQNWEQIRISLAEKKSDLSHMERELSSAGGAWAKSREEHIALLAKLETEHLSASNALRDLLSGLYPASIAGKLGHTTLQAMESELECARAVDLANKLSGRVERLSKKVLELTSEKNHKKLEAAISKEFSELIDVDTKFESIHSPSSASIETLRSSLDRAGKERSESLALSKKLDELEKEIEKVKDNASRAPSEERLQPITSKISALQEAISADQLQMARIDEQRNSAIRQAIQVAKELDKLGTESSTSMESADIKALADSARAFLKDFSRSLATSKVKDLENEFSISFQKLARKEDIHYSAKISPDTFKVSLVDSLGNAINKNDLSAGEKQIYAIAILEALARTSGRKLPVIIDTPLGRLDSVHRTKLINNYFPTASHQVIILSTDTEVDEEFYSSLSPNISHAYKLEFNQKTRSSSAEEGYFWRQNEAESA